MTQGHGDRGFLFGHSPTSPEKAIDLQELPDWQQSDPKWIRGALRRVMALPTGGWHVIDAVRAISERPQLYQIADREIVAWRGVNKLLAAPNACPHLGASLAEGHTKDGCLICPWHGLVLNESGHSGWRPLRSYNDGVLFWVRLDGVETPTREPYLCNRPTASIDAVVRMESQCDPQDIIANRLDPWHGAHFHPHSFGKLRVIDQNEDSIVVRVTYRASRRMGVEVDARFDCPDSRTIVMTIIDGEGTGSVVETHATPVAPGKSAIIEATLATSERLGFRLARRVSGLVRFGIRRRAHRLWVEDAAYAERRYSLRSGKV